MPEKCDITESLLRSISSLHSNSSARDIINENFSKINDALVCLSEFTIDDLDDLIFPDPPELNQDYVIRYDGDNFVLVEDTSGPGTLFHIRSDQEIVVEEDRQYIVFDRIIIDGTLVLEDNSELVVL